jgi:hypothetical protein
VSSCAISTLGPVVLAGQGKDICATGHRRRSQGARRLLNAYDELQAAFTIDERLDYGPLVVPNGNGDAAIHRWFKIKESFSCDLVTQIVADLGLTRRGLRLLDPYAGAGTALVSAAEAAPLFNYVAGIERNPFLRLVSATKVRALRGGAPDLAEAATRVRRVVRNTSARSVPTPELSTFRNRDYFTARTLNRLLALRRCIDDVEMSELTRDILRVCLGASIEPVSYLRRDGRALRYESRKNVVHPVSEFFRRVSDAVADVEGVKTSCEGDVVLGDGRNIQQSIDRRRRFDLALFSPPYPNNIDYTEVYKLENWLLGYISSGEQFRNQRLMTFRSHPSVDFSTYHPECIEPTANVLSELLAPLISALPSDRYYQQRKRLIHGYFEDMVQTLSGVYAVLADDGRAVYIVGNSAHGRRHEGLVIASDILIARLAEAVGFKVEKISVARYPARRNVQSPFLRESVVFLAK